MLMFQIDRGGAPDASQLGRRDGVNPSSVRSWYTCPHFHDPENPLVFRDNIEFAESRREKIAGQNAVTSRFQCFGYKRFRPFAAFPRKTGPRFRHAGRASPKK